MKVLGLCGRKGIQLFHELNTGQYILHRRYRVRYLTVQALRNDIIRIVGTHILVHSGYIDAVCRAPKVQTRSPSVGYDASKVHRPLVEMKRLESDGMVENADPTSFELQVSVFMKHKLDV
jgi:hypothetical protein